MSDESTLRSRRALLAGAAGGAAAIAANAALPASRALAVDQFLLANVDNPTTANTSLTADIADGPVLSVVNTDTDNGGGLWGQATAGPGVAGATSPSSAGVVGVSGDSAGAATELGHTGVYGYSEPGDGTTTFGAGIWGDSADFGVYGSGSTGVLGDGGTTGTGLEGFSVSGYGLYVTGKVKLATRSGRLAVPKGKASISKSVTGLASSNIVIAVLQTPETGTWVRAAVASTNKFTVYFNKALPSSSIVGWIVLN